MSRTGIRLLWWIAAAGAFYGAWQLAILSAFYTWGRAAQGDRSPPFERMLLEYGTAAGCFAAIGAGWWCLWQGWRVGQGAVVKDVPSQVTTDPIDQE